MKENEFQLLLRKKTGGKASREVFPSPVFGTGLSLFLALFLLSCFLISCDVEKYGEASVSMNTPLALSAIQVSNTVHLEFWGLNEEAFFQGYDIRIITNNSTVSVWSNLSGTAIPNSGEDQHQVALNGLSPSSTALFFTFDVLGYPYWITQTNVLTNTQGTSSGQVLTNITNVVTNYATNGSFVNGQTYVFGVRAYTSLYAPYFSQFGNLASITFTN